MTKILPRILGVFGGLGMLGALGGWGTNSPAKAVDPDINLEGRGRQVVTGHLGLINFNHEQDPQATPPQLNTLLEGNGSPRVVSLYQIMRTDSQIPETAGSDTPSDYAGMIGLATQNGQKVLVPNSGYRVSGSNQAIVLYADEDQITIKYASDDNVVSGYTVHLENLVVNPELVAVYEQLNASGRNELPALEGGEIIGQATGEEMRVAIRDTGMFMDPRWRQDWWRSDQAVTGKKMTIKLIKPLLESGSACPVAIPSPSVAETKGESFIVKVNGCDAVAKQLVAKLKTIRLDLADNRKIADDYKDPLMRLSPYNEISNAQKTQKRLTAKGEVTFEYCEKDQHEWPTVAANSTITFEMPEWVWRWAAQAQITARYLNPAADPAKRLLADNPSGTGFLAQRSEETAILGEKAEQLAQAGGEKENKCPSQFYADIVNARTGEDGRLHYAVCIGMNGPGQIGDVLVNPQTGGIHYETIWPNKLTCLDTDYAGAEQFLPTYPAGTDPKEINVQLQIIEQPGYHRDEGCEEVVTFGKGRYQPIPPPKCAGYQPTGRELNPFKINCIAGGCVITTSGNWLTTTVTNAATGLVEQLAQFVCGTKEIVVTPRFRLPYLGQVDRYNGNTLGIFRTVGEDANEAFKRENALQNSRHVRETGVESQNKEEVKAEIYQQAKDRRIFEWVTQEALQPYTGNQRVDRSEQIANVEL